MVNRSPAVMRLLLVVSSWALAMPGSAQTTSPTPVSVVETDEAYTAEPAHVAYMDGVVEVTRDGRAEAASINAPLVSGDQVRTKDGRVEILFGDGSVLDADRFSTIDLLSDELIRLTDGRLRLTIGGRDRVSYRVDTPSASVRIDAPGEYRISLLSENGRRDDVELVTARGYATLVNELGETGVRAGERAFATNGMAPSYAQAYNSAAWDAFDRWAADRRDERTGTTSAQYLPDEIRGYAGDFDRYGAWQYDVTYGYVWYPRVYASWRPYYYGRWNYYGPWGWTWISYDRWGWPTHHYGRWGFRAGVWFWIPSRYWAPAYVYWAGASDYIGWCPLGWNNRPIFALNIGYTHYGYHGYDPYRAWTVVPRHAFRNHVDVRHYAVARADIDRAVPRWYVSGATAPVRPASITRQVSPIYSAGRNIAPRGRPDRTITTPTGGAARTAGVSSQPGPAPRGLPSRAVPRSSETETTREYRGGTPGANVPRATPPPSAGALGWPSDERRASRGIVERERGEPAGTLRGQGSSTAAVSDSRGRAVPRAPYRDAGPGGPEPRYQQPEVEYRSPGGWERRPVGEPPSRPQASDDRPSVGAPRGVPQGGIYGQRGVPRGGGVYTAPQNRYEPPTGSYPAPSAPGRARPGYGAGGTYTPRSSPPPSYGAPSAPSGPPRGAPPSARPSGGDRGAGERAAPRGGSSAGQSRPSGGHSRRPQQ